MKDKLLQHYLPVVLYMALLFILSVRPVPGEFTELWQIDKLFHLSAYIILGALVTRASAALGAGWRGAVMYGFIASLGYGLFTEVCQLFVDFRTFSFVDLAADGAGGLAGAVMYSRIFLSVKDRHV